MVGSAPRFAEDVVALFPGQGSIGAGAGAPWRASAHWGLVAEVAAATGVDVARLLLEADEEEVVRTDNAQLATFALSMIGYRDLTAGGVLPRYLLGHSLGEFSALVAAGLLSLDEGARLIAVRGSAMARAARATPGSMVALMGGEADARAGLATLDGVWVANVNGAQQVVVSGTHEGLADLLQHHRDLGWRRATALPVGGAFHSPLMAPAQNDLDAALERATWGGTEHVVVANVDGRAHADPREWRDLLSRQLTSPVEFLDATLALPASVRVTVEMPPGAVLTGLTRRIRSFDQQYAPADPAEMGAIAP